MRVVLALAALATVLLTLGLGLAREEHAGPADRTPGPAAAFDSPPWPSDASVLSSCPTGTVPAPRVTPALAPDGPTAPSRVTPVLLPSTSLPGPQTFAPARITGSPVPASDTPTGPGALPPAPSTHTPTSPDTLPPAPGSAPVPGPSPDSPGSAVRSADVHPRTDDACAGARTLLVRPQRDGGERTAPTGQSLFTPPYTPHVPRPPARPAPVAAQPRPGTAHTPSDLGRAPPQASST
ncbi:hypothetical protein ACFYOV_27340 [Streptomyces sp. NPDC005931]|uniref:hypothetical protein n=1 Tax=Streptomyces sp. NPDC005931 TaxID=3364737 RepID=UPI00369445C1